MDGQNVDDCGRVAFADKEFKHSRRIRKTVMAVFITAIFIASAVSAVAMNAKGAEERVFVIAMGEGVQSANPYIGIYDSDYMLYSYIYDYLMYPNQDGNATPNLATSWWHMDGLTASTTGSSLADLSGNISMWPAGSIWEYNLTENVTWSDGAEYDADDVVFSCNLQTGGNYATFWAYQPYTKWIDHCQKVSKYKVRYFFTDRTAAGNPPIPIAWGSCISYPIMPKHILQDMSPVTIAQNWTGVPAIGTGPFMGTDTLNQEIIAKEKITLVKNPQWELGLGKVWNRTCEIDKLIMKFYSEEQTLILDLKTKKLDASEVTAINYLSLQNSTDKPPELKLVSQFSSTVYTKISHFNFAGRGAGELNPARADPALLRATTLATDRDYIVDEIFRGLGTKGVGLLTPVFPKWYYDAWNDDKNESWFNVTANATYNSNTLRLKDNGTQTNGTQTYNATTQGALLYTYHGKVKDVMAFNVTRANAILNASGYDWPTYPNGLRKVGLVAAQRLVAMGKAGNLDSAMKDKNGNPRYLTFEDILEQEVFEDLDIAKYYQAQWKSIGVELVPTQVNTATWNQVVYNFLEHFTETYWSGDPDPNYLLYVPSSYSMDGWNEWGEPDPYYDYCYDKSARTFNTTERIHWVDECEKYLFLSGTGFLSTCNPKNCYGYLDYRWTNWGDWVAHPGLQVDHFWGECPLFMKVKWVGSPTETNNYLIPVAVGLAAVIAAVAAVVVLRKQKAQKMLDEEEEEEELEESEEEELS